MPDSQAKHNPKQLISLWILVITLTMVACVNIYDVFKIHEAISTDYLRLAVIFLFVVDSLTITFVIVYFLLLHWQAQQTRRNEQLYHEVQELNEKLAFEMQEVGILNEKMKLLIEMSDMIQACSTVAEATVAISTKCKRILHFATGTVYIMDPVRNLLEKSATWGDPIQYNETITLEQCWALRKGSLYQVKNPHVDLICEHIQHKSEEPYMCIPLMAKTSIYGMLHLDFQSSSDMNNEEHRILISAVTETLSLALANIKMRETLRRQSLHDNLTGLYNQRYLEEVLVNEIDDAKNKNESVAIFMLDLDNFKVFNDNYGHEAGNAVLQELGRFFRSEIRSNDYVCRYGGEEFLCLLHRCGLNAAKVKAEEMRNKIANLNVMYGNQKLPHITASVGISIFPQDGTSLSQLIQTADQALYQAKSLNKNKVVAYSEIAV